MTSAARPAVEHPRFARLFDRESRSMEDRGVGEHRRILLSGLSGACSRSVPATD